MRVYLLLACVAGAALASWSVSAAEIKVLTAGAFKPVVTAVVADFEKQSGHKVTVEGDTAGGLLKRINGGEVFDLVVITAAALDELTKSGKVAMGGTATLARVGVGVAVKRGAALPDISTVAAFQRTMLTARAVAYIDPAAGGSSGIYMSNLLEKMGIADRVKAKAVLVPGGLVAQRLMNDQADVAIHQISEILAVPEAVLVGPLPAEIQNYTVYSGGLRANLSDASAASALLAALSSPAARDVMKTKGLEALP